MLSNAKLSSALLDLLYLRKQVILPGIGTFILLPQMSSISQMEGTLDPPHNDLEFRDSFDEHNRELIQHLASTHNISQEQINFDLLIFIKNLRFKLIDQKAFSFQGFGKLTFDESKNLVFHPEADGLNDEFFGLSQIAFKPILRDREELVEVLEKRMATDTGNIPGSATTSKPRLSFLGSIPFLTIFFFLFGSFVLIDFVQQKKQQKPDFKAVKTRLNVSPPKQMEKKKLVASTEEVLEEKWLRVTYYTFAEAKNAEKTFDRIEKSGYSAFMTPSGNRFKVGIKLPADSPNLNNKLEVIREELGARSFTKS